MKIKPPEFMMRNGVRGIFVGGCIERGEGSSFRARAHAHNVFIKHPMAESSALHKPESYGWICFRSLKRIMKCVALHLPASGAETSPWDGIITATNEIIMHEYAHILTPNHSHDDAWRAEMRRLGQPLRRQYRKKTKGGSK